MNIAIQGERGSFHHSATLRWYGGNSTIVPCTTFRDVFVAIEEGLADAGIVAIENSLYGSINEVYDLLLEYSFPIVGEVPERIHQCLIGFEGTVIQDITHIHSHPVALSQCSVFLHNTLPTAKCVENYDTAASVLLVKSMADPSKVAIASSLAAQMYDMSILQKDIQNHDSNFTRFLVLEKTNNSADTNKASLVVETSHRPGALYAALGVFESMGINLTKLQSRPVPGEIWRYMFYIDIEGNQEQVSICREKLECLGCRVRVLGQYTSSKTQDI